MKPLLPDGTITDNRPIVPVSEFALFRVRKCAVIALFFSSLITFSFLNACSAAFGRLKVNLYTSIDL